MADIEWDESKAVDMRPAAVAATAAPPASAIAWDEGGAQKLAPSAAEAGMMGLHQALTLGFGDEAWGVMNAAHDKLSGSPESVLDLYRKHRDEYRAADALAKQAHSTAHFVGGLAGGLAAAPLVPAAAGWKGAAAVGTALGAASGLGTSDADLTRGDVAGAARDTAMGATVGAGAGALGHKIGDAVAPIATGLRSMAAKKAVGALGPTAGEVKKLGTEGVQDFGHQLLDKGLIKAGDKFEDIAARVTDFKGNAGKQLGHAIDELDKAGVRVDTADIAARFRTLAAEAEAQGPGAAPLAKKFREAADAVDLNTASSLPIGEAEAWKQAYQDRVNYGRINPSAAQEGDRELASAARQAVEDAATQSGQPAAKAFAAAKKDYGLAAKAEGMTEGAAGRKEARNILSPSDKALAGGGIVASLATGNLLPAVAGAGAALVNKVVRERASSTIAVAAKSASDKLQQLATSAPGKLGRYGPILSSALQRGQADFNANVYVLSQTDPQFQALQQRLAEEK